MLSFTSRGMVSKLKAMSTDNTQQDYSAMLECMCNWGKVSDLLELIGEWLDAGLAGHCEEDKANKVSVDFEIFSSKPYTNNNCTVILMYC